MTTKGVGAAGWSSRAATAVTLAMFGVLGTPSVAFAAPAGNGTAKGGAKAKTTAQAAAKPTESVPEAAAPAAPSEPAPAAAPVLSLDAPEPEEEEESNLPPTMDELAGRVKDLETQLQQTRDVALGRQPRVVLGGYIDFGFFVPSGDGSGVIRDDGHVFFPEYAGKYGWVFLGDLLAPAVNSRGEPADMGDLAGVDRFDSVHSRGAPSFIANEVNMTLSSALSPSALATASVNFLPRTGDDFHIGDLIEIDIAQLEWMPTKSQRTSIFVGKTDSVIGIEYRDRKSSQRFGITPSLIARYTVGTALGVKMRTKLGPDDMFVIAAAVQNGSNTIEQFHFFEEIDSNLGKTASGRLSLKPPMPFGDLEIGASGQYGQQDRVRSVRAPMWFWGVDLQAHFETVDVKGQYLRGHAPGNAEDQAYGLELHNGGYLEVDWMVTPMVGLMGRGELRDAFVWLGDPNSASGAERAYLTKSWRATAGLRLAISDRIVVKGEFLRNGEYGGVPGIDNDVVTTSLVLIE